MSIASKLVLIAKRFVGLMSLVLMLVLDLDLDVVVRESGKTLTVT